MPSSFFGRIALAATLVASSIGAVAEPLRISATMTPKEQIRLDFKDGSGHYVLMVRREGTAGGLGLFDKAHLVEYGRHDIVPGVAGDPSGYLVVTADDGAIAYLKWTVRSIFLPTPDGSVLLDDNGFWEVVSGTGKFRGLKGAGTMHIKSAGSSDRLFTFNGDLVPARP